MDDIEKLMGAIQELAGPINEVKEATDEAREEIAHLKETVGKHGEDIEQLMGRPTLQKLPVPGESKETVDVLRHELPSWMLGAGQMGDKHKGYFLDAQCRDMISKIPTIGRIMNEEYRERYAKFMLDVLTRTDLSEGTASQGGYLVPDEFEPTLLAFAREKSMIALPLCTIYPMGTDTKKVPAEASGATVNWTAEATAATESTGPTVAEVTLTAKRLCAFKEASNELIDDAAIDVVSWLTELFAEAIGLELDNQVLNGTGDPVSGVLTGAAGYSVVMASGSASFSMIHGDNGSNMMSNLKSSVLAGAVFVLHRTVFHYVRIMKDSNNAYIYGHPAAADPQAIWGLPYILSEKAPSMSDDAVSTPFMSLANFRYFALGRRKGEMRLFINPYSLDKENQTRFTINTRWGPAIGLKNAFVRLITAAS
ncbi:MAG: phage major capsid protein [Thermodesulfobacteriota bacterium]